MFARLMKNFLLMILIFSCAVGEKRTHTRDSINKVGGPLKIDINRGEEEKRKSEAHKYLLLFEGDTNKFFCYLGVLSVLKDLERFDVLGINESMMFQYYLFAFKNLRKLEWLLFDLYQKSLLDQRTPLKRKLSAFQNFVLQSDQSIRKNFTVGLYHYFRGDIVRLIESYEELKSFTSSDRQVDYGSTVIRFDERGNLPKLFPKQKKYHCGDPVWKEEHFSPNPYDYLSYGKQIGEKILKDLDD